jgi:hypothetical protein
MNRSTFWRLGRALLFGALIVGGTTTLAVTVPGAGASIRVAEASVALKDDNPDKKDKNKNKGSDDDQDHVITGQVLEIDTLKDPPELVLGSVDGETVIRVLKTDEIAMNGVRLGDYIEAKGEKQSERLFEATQLSVSEHYGDSKSENDNKD